MNITDEIVTQLNELKSSVANPPKSSQKTSYGNSF
jgi:hypothetical protein